MEPHMLQTAKTLAKIAMHCLASATGSKPSAVQADSFQPPCWIMAGWSNTGRTSILYGTSSIT